MRRVMLVVATLAALGLPVTARADLADETALAQRFAPVVRLVAQADDCGYGEPYAPIDVDVLFDEPSVALRGPWGADLVKVGPSAADLTSDRFEYHLDFPGNALSPGCDYERWGRRLTEGRAPAVYAHVAREVGRPGRLALQYWLYYVFNDWNNTHEGDWEMIQLVFDASTAAEALGRRPAEVGYSQHEGAERAAWDDEKLELVDGTHPVVHPAAGSHANFFDEGLHLGSSAEEGVGCDDTSGPTVELRPGVRTIPSEPEAALQQYPWIAFAGRWGELQRSIFNGPTGPNLKSQWSQPIEWSDGWRTRSLAVPGGGALGTSATDFFCDAVASGSNAVRFAADEPQTALLLLFVLGVVVVFALTRTTWRPGTPVRIARRRAWGQVLAASASMYFRRFPLFVAIGLLALPIAVVITVLQGLVLRASTAIGETGGESGGLLVALMVVIGVAFSLLGLGLVQAATARALVEIDAGRRVTPRRTFGPALGRIRPLLGAVVVASIVVSVLLTSIVLLPVAIWLAVRWALVGPVVALEGGTALGALNRSARLVAHQWFKVGSLAVLGGALALLGGPLVGALLILVTDVPLVWLNVVAGLIYAVLMPFVAVTTAYLYVDVRVRDELAEEHGARGLPEEIVIEG